MNTKTKILIVEDLFIEANHLRLMLKRAGYKVCGIARSVADAMRIIPEEKPGLVLLDIFLSGKGTGIDLAKYLKEENIGFIYLSANSNEEILNAAKATQPYGFLVKPFREKDLLVTLEIAGYHHEHGLESSLRKETIFQKQLVEISAKSADTEAKMLDIAKALQPLVPFDYLMCGSTNEQGGISQKALHFLRIGFDEYQTMTLEGLQIAARIRPTEMAVLFAKTKVATEVSIHVGDGFQKMIRQSSLQQTIADRFEMKANLVLPLLASTGQEIFFLSFFSRRSDAYTDEQIALCKRLQTSIGHAIEKIQGTDIKTSHPNILPSTFTANNKTQAGSAFEGIIGNSHLLLNVFDHITQVAVSDTSVLIMGESGTGKERIADNIHQLSPRRNKPLVKVNCAALPPNLIESELFGHEKGSFTGAVDRRIGRFEQAHNGTLFLDEIGEMPLEMQAKLLRVLQEKEIERIGGKSSIKVDVRIVTATNRNLEKEVAEGRFRLDLYYRLNVFPIQLPALRERKEDIPLLVEHFINFYNRKTGKKVTHVSNQVLKNLMTYHWPGNIRELENLIERSVLLAKGTVIEDIHLAITKEPEAANDTSKKHVKTIEENERDHIIAVLQQCNGRIRGEGGAADILGVPPTTLASKIIKLGIKRVFME